MRHRCLYSYFLQEFTGKTWQNQPFQKDQQQFPFQNLLPNDWHVVIAGSSHVDMKIMKWSEYLAKTCTFMQKYDSNALDYC